jgi:hypothetical protein
MTPEQLLAHQQLVINNLSSRLAAMEESASAPSPTAHSPCSNKAANPTPFAGVPDTLRPWILQVDTHLQLASISDPALQILVATQFLAPGPLTWVQTLDCDYLDCPEGSDGQLLQTPPQGAQNKGLPTWFPSTWPSGMSTPRHPIS